MATKYPLVVVRWKDASFDRGAVAFSDLPYKVVLDTVGWLVADDDDFIAVSSEVYVEGAPTALDGQGRQITSIPKSLILSITHLRKGRTTS